MPQAIHIRAGILEEMLLHARINARVECCGLLAGRDGLITTIYRATNAAANTAVAFEIAPRELFDFFRRMRAESLDHLGIYHSHPRGDNSPSPTDIAQSLYPDVIFFIISPLPDAPRPIRAFAIRDAHVTEHQIIAAP